MDWLKRIRPSGPASTNSNRSSAVPEGLWKKCPKCAAPLYRPELERNQDVCPKCGHHMRIGARRRLMPVVACAFEFAFHGGSMGYAVGEKFTRAATLALEQKIPFVCFAATGGARMQEALISLMQMAKTSAVLERLKIAGVPYISVMTDPVYGGVSASLSMLGDLNVAEPAARAGFAGPNIIEQTIRQKLPKGFQRSEFLLEKGHIDMIISRDEVNRSARTGQ